MAVSPDPIYGGFGDALRVHARRLDALTSNIANADTPGYKARDIDFRRVLSTAQTGAGAAMAPAKTHSGHIGPTAYAADSGEVWRVPLQPSEDGNTVDTQIEQAQFAEAAMHYEATLRFIDGKVKSLNLAIKGE